MCDHVPRHKGGTLLAYPTTVASFTDFPTVQSLGRPVNKTIQLLVKWENGRCGGWVGKYSVTAHWVHR